MFFGAVKMTKNPDSDKYSYSGYGIGFNSWSFFILNFYFGENFIIFGVENSSSRLTDNRTKDILGPIQGLGILQ